MKLFVLVAGLLLGQGLALAVDGPTVTFSKFFKGSTPEYVNITVDKAGGVIYKEAPDDERPVQFSLQPAETAEIFALADKLNHFSRPLESPAKVANMGMKTLRYENAPAKTEVKFNYTEDADARSLTDWFERVIETEQGYFNLERSVKFDKLGVNLALLQVQLTLERKRLIAPQQFLPLLDRVAKNESFMHMSRERAASLAEYFRKTPAGQGDKKSEQ